MEIENQELVWDNISGDWAEFKNNPDPYIIDFLNGSSEEEKILDLGCASGRFFIKTPATIYGLDFSKGMLVQAGKKAEKLGIRTILIHHDLRETLPIKDNFFDKIICIAALHCVIGEDARKNLLKEIRRILKPNGKAVIKVWNKNSPRFKNKQKDTQVRWRDKGTRYYYLYDAEELKKEIEGAGLKIVSLESKNPEGFEKQEIWAEVEK